MFVRFSTEIPHFILIPTNIWTPWTFFSSDLLKKILKKILKIQITMICKEWSVNGYEYIIEDKL